MRRRSRTATLAAVALLGGMTALRATSQTDPAPSCDWNDPSWTEPVTRSGVSFVWPELALGQGSTYAFGYGPAGVRGARGGIAALRAGTEDIGVPAGAIDFFDPVLAVDRGGTLHALWGEHEGGAERDVDSASRAPGAAAQFHLGRVFHARHRNGRWTRAQVVYRAPTVSWHRSLLARLVEDEGGTLHIAFVAKRSSAHTLVHMRRGRDGWRTTEWVGERRARGVPIPGDSSAFPAIGGFYPSLAVGEGGRIYLAFASPALRTSGGPFPGGDMNSVWVRRSDDAGLTWSSPVLVHRSGRAGGYELQILARGRDSVHLLWRKQASRQAGADQIPHAVSTDGGATWRDAGQVPVRGSNPVRHLRAVATSKGELYVAFAQQPATGTTPEERRRRLDNDRIFYSHAGASGWSAPRPLRPEMGVFPFDLRIDGSDRLHLLWAYMAAHDSGGGGRRRVLSYAVAAPCAADRR